MIEIESVRLYQPIHIDGKLQNFLLNGKFSKPINIVFNKELMMVVVTLGQDEFYVPSSNIMWFKPFKKTTTEKAPVEKKTKGTKKSLVESEPAVPEYSPDVNFQY